jgi:hypothetical protein
MTRPTRDDAAGRAYLDLQNRARREGRGTQELLTLYVVERWLARLAGSRYAEDFVLKGGMLLAAFGQRRPTVDADTLARNLANDAAVVAARVAEIAALPGEDGVAFLTGTVSATTIRDDAIYAGVRVTMEARIATAVVKLRLDVNFGDPVTPAPRTVVLPALRPGMKDVAVLGYPIETVLAEKIVTALDLGCEPAPGSPTGAASAYPGTSCQRTSRTSSQKWRCSPTVSWVGHRPAHGGSPDRGPGPRRPRGHTSFGGRAIPRAWRVGRPGARASMTPSVALNTEGVVTPRPFRSVRR